jgi:hypothetical protein
VSVETSNFLNYVIYIFYHSKNKAPAPTPAPSIAPLAEVEADPTEDDTEVPSDILDAEQKPDVERKKKRRDKKEREGSSGSLGEGASTSDPEKAKRNAICPWEDE